MPRRALPEDIDTQMLNATILLGSELSLDKVTTLKVANACGINEATVYRHFQDKETLLLEAMRVILKRICNMVQARPALPEGNASSVKATFYHVLDYLIEHPDEAGYFSHFRHSRFFSKASGLFEDACQNCTEKHNQLSDQYFQNTPWLKAYADLPERYELFKGFVLDVTVDYACEIAMGSLPNTPRIRDAIFAILFGPMTQFNH